MLQTDEVDDDYFTPVQSTSLANIFGKVSFTEEHEENESLKYTPPKPNTDQKSDDPKLTECIFACAVMGREWVNGTYSNRGKLGLAIVKIHKTSLHNIVLYDSNKTTLSCTAITAKLEIIVNSNNILYYDNLGKYWCVYMAQEGFNKITEFLKSNNVVLKIDSNKDCQSKSKTETVKSCDETDLFSKNINDVDSDTDSSVNRKTTILNRMAMMGQSVLPHQSNVTNKTSDSSDTNDSPIQTKAIRHKLIKTIVKRNQTVLSEHQKVVENEQRAIVQKQEPTDKNIIYRNIEGILNPNRNLGIFNKTGNDLDIYQAEQRLSNSELRINLNRVNDKIDHITEKLINMEQNIHFPNNFQQDILQKLMLEYENKIKMYEDYFKSKGIKEVLLAQDDSERIIQEDDRINILVNKIEELEKIIKDKDSEIFKFQNEVQNLLEEVNQHLVIKKNNADLLKKITDMEQTLTHKNEEFSQILNKCENLQSSSENDVGQNLKIIMNETYSIIASNFDDTELYRGEIIKKTIASVMRRVTIDSLNST